MVFIKFDNESDGCFMERIEEQYIQHFAKM